MGIDRAMSNAPPPLQSQTSFIGWGMRWGVDFIAGSDDIVPLGKPGGAPGLAPVTPMFL